MKKFLISTVATSVLLAISAVPAFAAAPVQPNCLGNDASGFAQALGSGFGGFLSGIATTTTTGVGDEFLAHKQGIPVISTCPINGFPTPYPLP